VARTQIYPGAGEHVSYAVEDIIYDTKSNIQSGFRACGIYPFNPRAVDQGMLLPSKPSDSLEKQKHTTLSEQFKHLEKPKHTTLSEQFKNLEKHKYTSQYNPKI
jgi:hypothetical protein